MVAWFYKRDGEEIGPADQTMLQVMVDLGHITAETEVRRSDQSFWVRASNSPLAELLAGDQGVAASDDLAEAAPLPPSKTIKPIGRWMMTTIRASLITSLVCCLAFSLFLTFATIDVLRSGGEFDYSIDGRIHVDLSGWPEFLGYITQAILVAFFTVVAFALSSFQVILSTLILVAIPLYLFWTYKVAEHIFHASAPGEAERPHHALIKHFLPPACFSYPRHFMQKLYRTAARQSGTPEPKDPRALNIWWRSYLLLLFGIVTFLLVFNVPQLVKYVWLGAIQIHGEIFYPLRYVAIGLFIATLWAAPLCLSAFLWLNSRISRALFQPTQQDRVSG